MNNKGFAITTMIYTAVILLSLIMFTVLKIESNRYIDQKNFVTDIREDLSKCLKEDKC